MLRVQKTLLERAEEDKMAKTVSKGATTKVKKYKDGSTGSFTKVKSNGKNKWIKSGSSPKTK